MVVTTNNIHLLIFTVDHHHDLLVIQALEVLEVVPVLLIYMPALILIPLLNRPMLRQNQRHILSTIHKTIMVKCVESLLVPRIVVVVVGFPVVSFYCGPAFWPVVVGFIFIIF